MKNNTIDNTIEEIKYFFNLLYIKHPFYNSLLTNLNLEIDSNEESQKYGIISKNNKDIIIDKNFAKTLIKNNKKVLFYYIIHELLHIILKHKIRGMGKEKKKWAKATDMAVDAVLKQDKVLQEYITLPEEKKGISNIYDIDNSVSNTAEDFYNNLKYNEEDSEKCDSEKDCKNNSSCNNKNEKKQDSKGKSCSNKPSHLKNHNWSASSKENNEEENEINANLLKARQFTLLKESNNGNNKSFGGIPGTFQEMINNILEPKTNLLEYINKTVQNFKITSYSYKRGDRRYLYNGLIIPSNIRNIKHFKMLFYIDTSGSVSKEELIEVISEIYHIINSLKSYEILVVQSDSGISDSFTISNKEPLDEDKLFTIKGRGGTEMEPLFEILKENDFDFSLVASDFCISENEKKQLQSYNDINIGFFATKDSEKEYLKGYSPLFKTN